jgi:hypothetical protein
MKVIANSVPHMAMSPFGAIVRGFLFCDFFWDVWWKERRDQKEKYIHKH